MLGDSRCGTGALEGVERFRCLSFGRSVSDGLRRFPYPLPLQPPLLNLPKNPPHLYPYGGVLLPPLKLVVIGLWSVDLQ